jgi:hypothetical protein
VTNSDKRTAISRLQLIHRAFCKVYYEKNLTISIIAINSLAADKETVG